MVGVSRIILSHGLALLLFFVLCPGCSVLQRSALAQMPEPEVHGVFEGDTMYTVLPPGAIPAISEPEFLSSDEADDQMAADEMVMGILVGMEARAYSLWHLDAHEIVNDSIAGIPIAATW